MSIIIILYLIGAGLLAFGIWEQKNKYSDRQFASAEVVAHQRPRTHGSVQTMLLVSAVNSAVEMVTPVVEFKNRNGCTKTVPLHINVSRMTFNEHPELDIGGRLTVSFFGDSPDECYLEDHPMKETVLQTSAFLLVGIAVLALAVLITVFYISVKE